MVYLTGDTHGDIDINKLSHQQWEKGKELTDKDCVVILGDFGLPFLDKEVNEDGTPAKGAYAYWIKWLAQKPYKILWVDGNHDNFNFWAKQPVSEWNGGRVQVHPHADNILHLMRGEIYEIDGKSYFAFGGAPSHDKERRTSQVDWWPEEEASYAEMENGLANLEVHNNQVDYILTHTLPKSIIEEKLHFDSESPTEKYLQHVSETVDFKMWFAGHFHRTTMLPELKTYILYNAIYDVERCQKQMDDFVKMISSPTYQKCESQIQEIIKKATKADIDR